MSSDTQPVMLLAGNGSIAGSSPANCVCRGKLPVKDITLCEQVGPAGVCASVRVYRGDEPRGTCAGFNSSWNSAISQPPDEPRKCARALRPTRLVPFDLHAYGSGFFTQHAER